MPDWLRDASGVTTGLPFTQQLIRLLAALVMGFGVAVIFRFSHGRQHPRAATLTTTLILLSMLIAMVSMVIGGSVALAFSLVGALSIVRFRTVVEDTRDTAFVIFAVIVGMAAGAGQLMVPLVGMPIVGAVAILLGRYGSAPDLDRSLLTVRLGLGRNVSEVVLPVLSRHCRSVKLTGAATAKQGASVEVTYSIITENPEALVTLVSQLNQVEGLQSVEIRPDA
ncbi:MAG: DUF4956 domain-containing protein [Planctomycetaceae bacterium]|nr:DUF4956 domain-containing protein [Planctomycetaceae bacterium]